MPSLKKDLKADQSYLTEPTSKGCTKISVQRYSKKMGSVFFQMPNFNKRETYKYKQTEKYGSIYEINLQKLILKKQIQELPNKEFKMTIIKMFNKTEKNTERKLNEIRKTKQEENETSDQNQQKFWSCRLQQLNETFTRRDKNQTVSSRKKNQQT